jgi:hypothetical protein
VRCARNLYKGYEPGLTAYKDTFRHQLYLSLILPIIALPSNERTFNASIDASIDASIGHVF